MKARKTTERVNRINTCTTYHLTMSSDEMYLLKEVFHRVFVPYWILENKEEIRKAFINQEFSPVELQRCCDIAESLYQLF